MLLWDHLALHPRCLLLRMWPALTSMLLKFKNFLTVRELIVQLITTTIAGVRFLMLAQLKTFIVTIHPAPYLLLSQRDSWNALFPELIVYISVFPPIEWEFGGVLIVCFDIDIVLESKLLSHTFVLQS